MLVKVNMISPSHFSNIASSSRPEALTTSGASPHENVIISVTEGIKHELLYISAAGDVMFKETFLPERAVYQKIVLPA